MNEEQSNKSPKVFEYKGYYDPLLDEYVPDCKVCSGEGWLWARNISEVIPCKCNPERLPPEA